MLGIASLRDILITGHSHDQHVSHACLKILLIKVRSKTSKTEPIFFKFPKRINLIPFDAVSLGFLLFPAPMGWDSMGLNGISYFVDTSFTCWLIKCTLFSYYISSHLMCFTQFDEWWRSFEQPVPIRGGINWGEIGDATGFPLRHFALDDVWPPNARCEMTRVSSHQFPLLVWSTILQKACIHRKQAVVVGDVQVSLSVIEIH